MNVVIGRPTWMICDSRTGIPISSVMSLASGSMRDWSPSAMRCRYFARSSAEVSAHPGNASFAAATARSTSSGVPSAMRPTTSSVVGLTTSIVSVPVEDTQAPPT
jgi:hypothetical protein